MSMSGAHRVDIWGDSCELPHGAGTQTSADATSALDYHAIFPALNFLFSKHQVKHQELCG